MPEPDDNGGCRPHERRWRDRCVDAGLRDEWLERLNALTAFELISICEGHGEAAETEHYRMPHFYLRLRDDVLLKLDARWGEFRLKIAVSLNDAFTDPNTEARFEFRGGFVRDADGITPQNIALLKITARFNPLAPTRDIPAWFDENIPAAESFDQTLHAVLVR